jgi:hypothetical protein
LSLSIKNLLVEEKPYHKRYYVGCSAVMEKNVPNSNVGGCP